MFLKHTVFTHTKALSGTCKGSCVTQFCCYLTVSGLNVWGPSDLRPLWARVTFHILFAPQQPEQGAF